MFRKQRDTNPTDTTQLTNEIVATATDPGLIYDMTPQITIPEALTTNIFVTDIDTTKPTTTINTTETLDSLLTFTEMTPQTSILDTPATNTFPTFPDFTELMNTPSATVTTNTVPIYDMALHTTILNKSKTNTTAACTDLEQLTKAADTTTKSVPIYDMTQKNTILDTRTTNTFSTFTDMTQQTMQLDTTTTSNSLQTSTHLPQQTVTHTTTNTDELRVPLDWTDTTLTHLSLDIISKKIDDLEEKINRILFFLEMPKKANIKQKKTEHHIQILPTQDENGEYTIPPEVKQKILNSSTGKGNFAKNLVFTIFHRRSEKATTALESHLLVQMWNLLILAN